METNSFSSSHPFPEGSSSTTTAPAAPEKKKTARLSTDAQSVAARERRHRISERFKILQSLVPGGMKMDTVTMLEEAIHYVKFLKAQIWLHQTMILNSGGHYNAACLDAAGAYAYGVPDYYSPTMTSHAPPYNYYDDDEVRGYVDPAFLQQQPEFLNSGPEYDQENMLYYS